jgi:hypothetical protein
VLVGRRNAQLLQIRESWSAGLIDEGLPTPLGRRFASENVEEASAIRRYTVALRRGLRDCRLLVRIGQIPDTLPADLQEVVKTLDESRKAAFFGTNSDGCEFNP